MDSTKKPLIVIGGPTASGKSSVAVEAARLIGNAEIISADSMQVYRYMDIGSAKITLEEMMGVPHHMIDVAEPTDAFDVARYAAMAKACIEDIHSRGKVPIICGGTGFYIQAVVNDIDFEETCARPDFRESLLAFAAKNGNAALFEKLKVCDPASAAIIHPNNLKRVIRALEYYEETGRSIAAHNEEEHARTSPYDLTFVCLNDDRACLYKKIEERIDFMLAEGLMDEVAYLKSMGLTADMVSMHGIGYKEFFAYLNGETTYEETVAKLKLNTRHYAKRQITWFKREKEVIWLDRRDFDRNTVKMAEEVCRLYNSRRGKL